MRPEPEDTAAGDELTRAHPRDIGDVASAIPTPRRYRRGASIGTGSMFGDSSRHLSDGRPQPAAPERDTAQQTGDELELRLQRTLDLRLAPEQLSAVVEIHRSVAGHLDRKALFTAIAQALQGVVPVSRSLLLLPGNDPAALTIYASYGKLGLEFYEGQTIARAGSIPGWVVEHGRPFVLDRAEHIRERFPVSYQRLGQWGMESVAVVPRSEEHTSELQSPCNLVCRLLLEKKKKHMKNRLHSRGRIVLSYVPKVNVYNVLPPATSMQTPHR